MLPNTSFSRPPCIRHKRHSGHGDTQSGHMLAEFTFADLMWSVLWFGLFVVFVGTWIWGFVRLIRRRDWVWLAGFIPGLIIPFIGLIVVIVYLVVSSRQAKLDEDASPPRPPPPPPNAPTPEGLL